MIYTELTKKAMKIAFDAHKHQTDKGGMPYIYHPIHIAEQMSDEATICVALLHDVAEDTNTTPDELAKYGFGDEIIDALRLLTHDGSVPYMEYIRRLKDNPVAAKVKIADLRHNSDLSRLDFVDDRARRRTERYERAIVLLINME